jgi:hypothetical protein
MIANSVMGYRFLLSRFPPLYSLFTSATLGRSLTNWASWALASLRPDHQSLRGVLGWCRCQMMSRADICPFFRDGMTLGQRSWKLLPETVNMLPSSQRSRHLRLLDQHLFDGVVTRRPMPLKYLLRHLKLDSISW